MNTAQQLLVRMGVDSIVVTIAHKVGMSTSHTRSGPGRIHKQGKDNTD